VVGPVASMKLLHLETKKSNGFEILYHSYIETQVV